MKRTMFEGIAVQLSDEMRWDEMRCDDIERKKESKRGEPVC